MNNKINSKLLLVDESEFFYIFQENNFKPLIWNKLMPYDDNFEFIVSSKNKFIKSYISNLYNFQEGLFEKVDLIEDRCELKLDDISNDLNKVRDVNTVLTKNGNLNIIDANNIILDSFEITFDNDFNIVKENLLYKPYVQNPNTALGFFENATLFKPFLEESLNTNLKYFSFNKCNDQLYINFIDDSNQQYFIKDNLLHAFIKENFLRLKELYQNKCNSNYKEDSIIVFKNYYEVSKQIKQVLNDLDEFNKIENNLNYISSRDSSLIFNASLTSIACINNPSIAPVLVFLPLAEEVSISLTSNFISNTFNISEDEALFMSKVSFTLVKSGINNLDIDVLDIMLNKNSVDDKFNKLVDSSNLDNNIKDALKHIYKETRSTDFDNLNIFGLEQISNEIKKEFNLIDYTKITIKESIENLGKDSLKDILSNHSTFINKEKQNEDDNYLDRN